MKKHFIAGFILIFAINLSWITPLYSQPNTLYFMKGIPQTKDLNPARSGIKSGWYLALPIFSKLDLSANTNNWSYNDIIHQGAGSQSDSLVWDFPKFISAIGNKNFVFESAALTVLEGGFKKDKNFFSLSLTEKEFAETYFDQNLVDLIYYGNAQYVGQTYTSGYMGVGAQHYREVAFTYARDVSDALTVGATAKLLFGMSAIKTNGMNLQASSPANGEYLDVTATGRVDVSAPLEYTFYNDPADPTNSSNGYLESVNSVFDANNYFTNFSNMGFAIDLGFAYQVNDNFQLSVSMIDLGTIGWKTNTQSFIEQGQFRYSGVELANPINSLPTSVSVSDSIDTLVDKLKSTFRPDTTTNGFSTGLPTKFYVGGDYLINDIFSVSGLARVRIYNNMVHSALTLSGNALLWDRLTLSASYSVMESTYDNIGLGIGYRGGPFQIYAAADNLISPFYPSKARNMNLRVGINLIFGESDDDEGNGKKGRSGRRSGGIDRCP